MSALQLTLLAVALASAGCAGPQLDSTQSYERYLALQSLPATKRLSAVSAALEDPDWRVSAAACAIAQQHRLRAVAPRVVAVLERRRVDDPRIEHMLRLLATLAAEPSRDHTTVIAGYLKHARPSVRAQALRALSSDKYGLPGFESHIDPLLHDADPRIQTMATTVLNGYRTRQAYTYVARAQQRWADLARRGEVDVLLESIKAAPTMERPWILVEARSAGRPLMLAVLRDAELIDLHRRAHSILARDGGPKTPEMRRFEQRFRVKIEPQLSELLGRCGTPQWPAAWEKLSRLAMQPELAFLGLAERMRATCPAGSGPTKPLDANAQRPTPTHSSDPQPVVPQAPTR